MPQVKHFGVVEFKDEVSRQQIDECFTAMQGMVGRIPGLLEMQHGPYDSPEGMNDGYTHGFIMTFDSAEARDAYLPHPIHEEIKALVVPRLKRVVVVDFIVPSTAE